MPIYEYRCESCGFQKEFIQRMSDAPLTDCPECAKPTFSKMVTAAGFQLKGSGWYVTDFRNNKSNNKTADSKKSSGTTAEKSADTSKSDNVSKSADSAPAASSSSSTAPAATSTPAPASGKTA